jgi:ribosomal-protein-alanine N-acetyltransferase
MRVTSSCCAESKASDFSIRPMRAADLEAVAAIERRSYRFPWSRQLLGSCLRAGYYCCVLEGADGVSGYALLTHAAGEAHLLNLCVAPEMQGKGLGRKLMQHLFNFCRYWGDEKLILEVRKSNQVAQNLYRQLGFRVIGERKNYYRDGDHLEDAIVMQRELALSTEETFVPPAEK